MTYSYALDAPIAGSHEEAVALVGGKAANLVVMTCELSLPVPPGFAISTATCRAFLSEGWPSGLDDELRIRVAELEMTVGRRFGDASDPLLVSVRSGAPVSMPGMMDTILDLGLNDETTAGLARASGSEAFAQTCRDRFEVSFRSIVDVAEVPDDPWTQLRLAIEAVFRSWNSDRARAYREKEEIPDDLGTAATVQAMVFGNRGPMSATGVLFTRNPVTGEPALYGDVLFEAQGEDVVAGTHQTEPIAVLDGRLPAVARELHEAADRLERRYRDLCDIEFTIEDGRLWLLQVRVGKRSRQAALRIAIDMANDPGFPLSRREAVERVLSILADPPTTTVARDPSVQSILSGLPASPGVASGPIVTSPEAAQAFAEHDRPAILVRAETSPDDIRGMAVAAGILTSRGGLASHAAVVARGWGIPAVVGAERLEVGEGEIRFDDRVMRTGELLTIDGGTGKVFEGEVAGSTEVAPEALTLLEWTRVEGIEIDGAPPTTTNEPAASSTGPVDADRILRTVAIKGFALPDAIADAVLASPDEVRPIVDRLVADGLVDSTAGAYQLTDAGRARADRRLVAERNAWGLEAATAALDAFLDIDHRVKETVTAWQLRDETTPNDHTDTYYDASVLDRLAGIHGDATVWHATLAAGCPRLADYGARLSRALDAARAGDGRFVASPRVDSYHGIWFELHEDLIRLAGRTREEESAAGRA